MARQQETGGPSARQGRATQATGTRVAPPGPRQGPVRRRPGRSRPRRVRRRTSGLRLLLGTLLVAALLGLGGVLLLGTSKRSLSSALVGTWELADALPPIIGSILVFRPDGSFELKEQRSVAQGVWQGGLSGRFAVRNESEIVLDISDPRDRVGRSVVAAKVIGGNHLALQFPAGQLIYKRR